MSDWTFRAPSERCETHVAPQKPCGRQAVAAYPAMGGGYHSVCTTHMQKHQSYCVTLDEARRGKLPKTRPASRDGSQP